MPVPGFDRLRSLVRRALPPSVRRRLAPLLHRLPAAHPASGSAQARRYWESEPDAALRNQWTSNAIVGEVVYRRMSGGRSSAHWIWWLLDDYFRDRKFARALSPGCGVGDHEIILMKSGKIGHLDAFDFSAAALDQARAKARAENLDINFYQDDLESFSLEGRSPYDLILCSGAVHHVRELERFFDVVRNSLSPEGVFVFNEYAGACYNVYPPAQLEMVNRLLRALAPRYRAAPKLAASTIEAKIAADPSESVRSALVLPFARNYFDFEFCHPFGGAIMHPLYPLLNNELFSTPTPDAESILRLLLEIEQILLETGVLPTDFVLCVCRPKKR